MSKIAAIIGRIFIALIFVLSGLSKLTDVAATNAMITSVGLPGGLAIPVGLFELIAGLCLAAGFMVRLVSGLLAIFVAMTILFFHNQLGDPMQRTMFLKNVAVIGGLLLAFAHSQMWGHYYALRRETDGVREARSMEERLHEAELRAARAEAKADALESGRTVAADPAYPPAGTVTSGLDGEGVRETRRHRWFDW